MVRRQPACCSFCAMAQAMLRLLARPKITAVFCGSVIHYSPDFTFTMNYVEKISVVVAFFQTPPLAGLTHLLLCRALPSSKLRGLPSRPSPRQFGILLGIP